MKCSHCKWQKIEKAHGTTYALCSNPKVKGKSRGNRMTGELVEVVIFCDIERRFESGCGRAGRFFERR